MHEATRILEWDMGHRVPRHSGMCRTPHGHRYKAEITCAGKLGAEGFVLDFGMIKARVGVWIAERLDHTTAYQRGDKMMESFAELNAAEKGKPFYAMDEAPTAENLAALIFGKAVELLPEVSVLSVVVWETPNCSGAYRP
jgi:6-pyruvoyl tetrahydropterin synthase/QueD family protein